MTLPRLEVVEGFEQELARLEDLVRSLSEKQLSTPTRCEGWTVGDVAAHVAGSLADIMAGRFDGLGTPEVTAREVAERRGRTANELADELHDVAKQGADLLSTFNDEAWEGPAPTPAAPSLGNGVEALWYDAYLHGEDIRAALGLPATSGAGLRAAVSHVAGILADRSWGPAIVALDGVEEFPVGSGGTRITGDPLQFVLVATGREDPAVIGLDSTVNIYA